MSVQFTGPAAASLFCLLCFGLPGCIAVSENSANPRIPTVGRELQDLKTARDAGAIDPEEYTLARHNLLKRLDRPCKS